MFDGWTDEQFAAWLAGFFDGEGCVYIPKRTGIDVSIANTERALIEAIHTRLGVGIIEEVTYDRPEWKTKYHWRVRNYPEAAMVIRLMLPFLTIKQAKALEALERTDVWANYRARLKVRNAEIMRLAAEGMLYKDISALFGLDAKCRTVGYIVRGIIKDGSHPLKAANIRQLRNSHETLASKSAGLDVTTTTRIHHRTP